MNLEKYTERARGFVQSAQSLALREGHQQFTPEHVLKVLLDDEEGLAAGLIDRAGGNSRQALTEVEAALAKLPKVEGSGAGQLYMAPTTARLFDNAEKIAQKAGDSFVTVERLLLALAMEKGTQAAKILANAGVSAQTLNAAINDIRKGRTADSASAENQYDALKKYTRDLTEAARTGTLDPVIGFGGALGVTAKGWLNPSEDQIDIDGTLAPAYVLNSIIGNLPVIGSILTGGEGQGLFAAAFRLTGSNNDPTVTVNPLSALTPGLLRHLFDPLLGTSQTPPTQQAEH